MIVGVDVGGTFTDAVAWSGDRITTAKLPTTTDQSEGVLAAAGELAERCAMLLHGTTAATNALLERRGARTALVTDAGFEDVLEIGRQDRPSLYDVTAHRPEPLVPRRLRVTDPEGLAGVDAVAVSLLRSYEDPAAEREMRHRLRAALGDVAVSLSSEVAPEFREFERTSTTVLNAYLQPVVSGYLAALVERVAQFADEVAVMRSSGGLMAPSEAAALPAAILLSGPAGGAVAAGALGAALGKPTVVAFDMGGTSTDVCRIENGRPELSYHRTVDGYACLMPATAIHTVGAGGGSLGWVDAGGSLRVGPRSAGAEPGPACYGRGGSAATVTDANVVLGRIAPAADLGGRLRIRRALAEEALSRLAGEAGISRDDAALGMVTVVEEVMAGALRTVSIEEGADPRGAWLVAFGGAGGLHASALAANLGMAGVLVPPHGGVFSALGLLLSPPRTDLSRSVLLGEGGDVDSAIRDLTQADSGGAVSTFCDVRYVGQSHELTVPYRPGEGWGALGSRFHDLHAERNGFARRDDPIEVVTVRAEVTSPPPLRLEDLPPWEPVGDAKRGERPVLTGDGELAATVWWRPGLSPGDHIDGPAVVEEREATTYLAPGERGVVHETGTIEVTRS